MIRILKGTVFTVAVFVTLLIPAMLSWALASLAVIALSTQPAYPQSRSGQELFQQALAMARAQGKLAEAIALYQRVVAENPKERALVAQALVQVGRCHERMGSQQAKAAYERVIKDFADQVESAALARTRLNGLSGSDRNTSSAASTLHRLATLPRDSVETVTDGQFAVYERFLGNSGGVEALEIRTRKTWSVQPAGAGIRYSSLALIPSMHFSGRTAARPMVAFSRTTNGSPEGLFLSNLDGTGERLLRHKPGYYSTPGSVSPSAPGLLPVNFYRKVDGRFETGFAIVNLRDGGVVSEGSRAGDSTVAEVAPGGKHLVVASDGDIYLTDLSGNVVHPLVQHPGRDAAPATFLEKGTRFCWGSDRSGFPEIWCQPMRDLRPDGKPQSLSGANFPVGTAGGNFEVATTASSFSRSV